jgi:hypothetical protein
MSENKTPILPEDSTTLPAKTVKLIERTKSLKNATHITLWIGWYYVSQSIQNLIEQMVRQSDKIIVAKIDSAKGAAKSLDEAAQSIGQTYEEQNWLMKKAADLVTWGATKDIHDNSSAIHEYMDLQWYTFRNCKRRYSTLIHI